MRRRLLSLGVTLIAATIAAVSPGSSEAATGCGYDGWAAYEGPGDEIFSVEGEVRTRDVACRRAHKILGRYLYATDGEGGPLQARGFRCRGGPRPGDRFIASCTRDGGSKRVFLDGTGGPR